MDSLPRSTVAPPPKPLAARQPPKLGIRKRKPRSAAVVTAANHRARVAPALPSAPPLAVPAPAPAPPSPAARPASPPQSALLHPPNLPPLTSAAAARISDAKRKGLRHFAIRVSRKVEQKGVTTYNEVADELVAEERRMRQSQLAASGNPPADNRVVVDEKNIRRRVYDSLNVLMAMRIIAKERKLITWQGLAMAQSPRGTAQIAAVKAAIAEKRRALEEKTSVLAEIKEQYRRTTAIVDRNRAANASPDMEDDTLLLPQSFVPLHQQYPERLGIPFIIVSAPKDTSIELEMDETREDIQFTFNSAFAIYDDREVMRRMVVPLDPPSSNDASELERLRRHVMDSSTPPVTP